MKKGFVYILLSHDKQIYKIGTTDNIKIRLRALKKFWGDFDTQGSFCIECDREYKFRLESMLLNLVVDSQVKFDENEKENGWSEFFYIDSLEPLKTFIDTTLLTFKKDLKVVELKDIEK